MHLRRLKRPTSPPKEPVDIDPEILSKYRVGGLDQGGPTLSDLRKISVVMAKPSEARGSVANSIARKSRPKVTVDMEIRMTQMERNRRSNDEELDDMFGDLDLCKNSLKVPSRPITLKESYLPVKSEDIVRKGPSSDEVCHLVDAKVDKKNRKLVGEARRRPPLIDSEMPMAVVKRPIPKVRIGGGDDDGDMEEWKRVLRGITGYDPNDRKFRIRDSEREPIESSFDQMSKEERNSVKCGVEEDRHELQMEQRKKKKVGERR